MKDCYELMMENEQLRKENEELKQELEFLHSKLYESSNKYHNENGDSTFYDGETVDGYNIDKLAEAYKNAQ